MNLKMTSSTRKLMKKRMRNLSRSTTRSRILKTTLLRSKAMTVHLILVKSVTGFKMILLISPHVNRMKDKLIIQMRSKSSFKRGSRWMSLLMKIIRRLSSSRQLIGLTRRCRLRPTQCLKKLKRAILVPNMSWTRMLSTANRLLARWLPSCQAALTRVRLKIYSLKAATAKITITRSFFSLAILQTKSESESSYRPHSLQHTSANTS